MKLVDTKFYIAPLYFVSFVLLLLFLVQKSFDFPYGVLIFSIFLCTFPNLLQKWSLPAILLFEFILVISIGYFLKESGLILIIACALLGLIQTLRISLQKHHDFFESLISLLGSLLMAVFCVYFVWFHGIYKINYELSTLNGDGQLDTYFHMAISNMIVNEGVPSTGLNLTPLIRYHYLSNLIIGFIRSISGLSAIHVYPYAIPFFFVPIFLQILEALVCRLGDVRNKFTLFGALALFGSIPFFTFNPLAGYMFLSESYLLGILILWIFLYQNISKRNFLINLFIVLLSFFAKSSVGILLFFINTGLLIFEKERISKKLVHVVLHTLLATITAYFAIGGAGDVGSQLHFSWLNYYKYLHNSFNMGVLSFFWIHFRIVFLTWAYVIILRKKFRKTNTLFIFSAVTAVLLGFLVINTTSLVPYWFVILPNWIALPIMIVCLNNITANFANFRRIYKALLVFFGALVLLNLGIGVAKAVSVFIYYYNNQPTLSENGRLFFPYYQALEEIRKHDKNMEYVVEIPNSEIDYWQHGNSNLAQFYIPALSGRPALNALKVKNTPFYGHYTYYNQSKVNVCFSGYKGVIRIWKSETGKVVYKIFNCDSDKSLPSLTEEKTLEKSRLYTEWVVKPSRIELHDTYTSLLFEVGTSRPKVINNHGNIWLSGWAWPLPVPTSSTSLIDIKYRLIRLKELFLEIRAKTKLEYIEIMLWHATKRLQENKPQEALIGFEKITSLLRDLYDSGENSLRLGIKEEEYFGLIKKTVAYLKRAKPYFLDARFPILVDDFDSWVVSTFDRWCPNGHYCYGTESLDLVLNKGLEPKTESTATTNLDSHIWTPLNLDFDGKKAGFSIKIPPLRNFIDNKKWNTVLKVNTVDNLAVNTKVLDVSLPNTLFYQYLQDLETKKVYTLSMDYLLPSSDAQVNIVTFNPRTGSKKIIYSKILTKNNKTWKTFEDTIKLPENVDEVYIHLCYLDDNKGILGMNYRNVSLHEYIDTYILLRSEATPDFPTVVNNLYYQFIFGSKPSLGSK